jgi:hypothetical protein
MTLNVTSSNEHFWLTIDNILYLKEKATGRIVYIVKPYTDPSYDLWTLQNGEIYHGKEAAMIAALQKFKTKIF